MQMIDMECNLRQDTGGVPPVKLVAGNKCDLKDGRVISSRQGLEYARSRGCGFMETSAREMVNIEETFARRFSSIVRCRVKSEWALPHSSMIVRASLIAWAKSCYVPSNRPSRGRRSSPCRRHHCRTATEKPRSLLGITNAAIPAVRRERSRHHRFPGKAWSQEDEAGWILGEIQMLVKMVAWGLGNGMACDIGKGNLCLDN